MTAQLAFAVEDDRLPMPPSPRERAEAWIAANTNAWVDLISMAINDINSRQRPTMKFNVEAVRRRYRIQIDNTLTRHLVDIAEERYPELRGAFMRRKGGAW
jgi:hypothetical protein